MLLDKKEILEMKYSTVVVDNSNNNKTVELLDKSTLVVLHVQWSKQAIEYVLMSLLPHVRYIDVVIVEYETINSKVIIDLISAFVKKNLVTAHVRTVTNLYSAFMPLGYFAGIAYSPSHAYETVCFSDGDAIFYGPWLKEIMRILNDPDVFLAILSLDPFNNFNGAWFTKDKERLLDINAGNGMQMQCMKKKKFAYYLEQQQYKLTEPSNWMFDFIPFGQKFVRTRENYLAYYMWSFQALRGHHYRTFGEYFDFRVKENCNSTILVNLSEVDVIIVPHTLWYSPNNHSNSAISNFTRSIKSLTLESLAVTMVNNHSNSDISNFTRSIESLTLESLAVNTVGVSVKQNISFKRKSTLVVVLAYWNVDTVDSMLRSVLSDVDFIDVVVVECNSTHSISMKSMIKKYVQLGLVAVHIYTRENIFGSFIPLGYLAGKSLNSNHVYDRVCFSDGDVLMYGDWHSEIVRLLDMDDIFFACASLNIFNNIDHGYIVYGKLNVSGDYILAHSGMQMQCVSTLNFEKILEANVMWVDSGLHFHVSVYFPNMRYVRTSKDYLVHMMWSAYATPDGMFSDYLANKQKVRDSGTLWGPLSLSQVSVKVLQLKPISNFNIQLFSSSLMKYVYNISFPSD